MRTFASIVVAACMSVCSAVTLNRAYVLSDYSWPRGSDAPSIPSVGDELVVGHFNAMVCMFEAFAESVARERGCRRIAEVSNPSSLHYVPISALNSMVAEMDSSKNLTRFAYIQSFRTAFAQWLASSNVSTMGGDTVWPLCVKDSGMPYAIPLADGSWHPVGTSFNWSRNFAWEHADFDFSGVFAGVTAPVAMRRSAINHVFGLLSHVGWNPVTSTSPTMKAGTELTVERPGDAWTNNVIACAPMRAEADILSKFTRSYFLVTNQPTFATSTDHRLWRLTCDTEKIRRAIESEIESARQNDRDPEPVTVQGVFSESVTNWTTSIQQPTFDVGFTDRWSINNGLSVKIEGPGAWYEPTTYTKQDLSDLSATGERATLNINGVQVTGELYTKTISGGFNGLTVEVECPEYTHESTATRFTSYPFTVGVVGNDVNAVYWIRASWDDGSGEGGGSLVTSDTMSAWEQQLACVYSRIGMMPSQEPNSVDPNYQDEVTIYLGSTSIAAGNVYYLVEDGEDGGVIELGFRNNVDTYSGPITAGPQQVNYSATAVWVNDWTSQSIEKWCRGSIRMSGWIDWDVEYGSVLSGD